MKVKLTLDGMKNLRFQTYENDFTFLFADGSKYMCPRFIADFVSPKIAQLHGFDVTYDVYQMDSDHDKEQFQSFMKLILDENVRNEDAQSFIMYAKELGNVELVELFEKELENKITIDNVWTRIDLKMSLHMNMSEEMDFLASHFSIAKTKIAEKSFDVIYSILSSPELRLEDEDELYVFVRDLVAKDSTWFTPFELIDFSTLSKHSISDFIDFSSMFEISVNSFLWRKVCERMLIAERLPATRLEKRYESDGDSKEIAYDKVNPLNGIVSHLSEEFGGNAARCGAIDVLSSSCMSNHKPENIFDYDSQNYFESQPRRYQWIIIDFKNFRVSPTKYTLGTVEGASAPKTWVLDGSIDGEKWTLIDKRRDVKALRKHNANVMLKTIHQPLVRFIRLRQQSSHSGSNKLTVRALELFGTLEEGENSTQPTLPPSECIHCGCFRTDQVVSRTNCNMAREY